MKKQQSLEAQMKRAIRKEIKKQQGLGKDFKGICEALVMHFSSYPKLCDEIIDEML
jgi:hypothetical protein